MFAVYATAFNCVGVKQLSGRPVVEVPVPFTRDFADREGAPSAKSFLLRVVGFLTPFGEE